MKVLKRLSKKNIGDFVAIYWEDPTGDINGTVNDLELSKCVNIGMLTKLTPKSITLQAGMYMNDRGFGDGTVIHKGCVYKIEVWIQNFTGLLI